MCKKHQSCFLLVFPVTELRQLRFKIRARLLRRPVFVCHMLDQKIDQRLEIGVSILPIGVAPLAVFLVEGAVRLSADDGILQGHAAALADQRSRRAKECVD